jgi:hypothetical protein
MEHDCHQEHRIGRNEKDIKSIFELIEKVRNRLPVWATFAFSAAAAAIGWLAAYIGKHSL